MILKVAKEKKGITLIALVITIIVLLILAGISISMLTGQNGILNRASEAKEKTEIAGEEELRKLTQMQAAMNLENTTHTDNSTGEEKTVTIPAGFAVSQVEGENTIEDGLVIIDTKGNEFVWIPINEVEELYWEYQGRRVGQLYEFLEDGNSSKINTFEKGTYREPDTSGKDGWCDDDPNMLLEAGMPASSTMEEFGIQLQTEFEAMLSSISKYKGYYVGRYETGGFDKGEAVSKKRRE